MTDDFEARADRYLLSSAEFEKRLRLVREDQWACPTPCSEWRVRDLVNHVTRGNLNYVRLLAGGTSAEFLRLRAADALGTDPLGAYLRSVEECAGAFAAPGAMERVVDYPLGRVPGYQALAIRTADSAVHAWDLARAIGADQLLDAALVVWIEGHLEESYAGLPETPTAAAPGRFFAAPGPPPGPGASPQDRLLSRMGRSPGETR